ncbi:MAG: hypothetical protein AVDCRST_MAG30-1163, partial [uncultured Solirubrobacteraceae bacterium]
EREAAGRDLGGGPRRGRAPARARLLRAGGHRLRRRRRRLLRDPRPRGHRRGARRRAPGGDRARHRVADLRHRLRVHHDRARRALHGELPHPRGRRLLGPGARVEPAADVGDHARRELHRALPVRGDLRGRRRPRAGDARGGREAGRHAGDARERRGAAQRDRRRHDHDPLHVGGRGGRRPLRPDHRLADRRLHPRRPVAQPRGGRLRGDGLRPAGRDGGGRLGRPRAQHRHRDRGQHDRRDRAGVHHPPRAGPRGARQRVRGAEGERRGL